MFTLLKPSPFLETAPRWAVKVPRYPMLFGYSPFADLFICSEDQQQLAVLTTEKPELIPLNIAGISAFETQFLGNSEVKQSFFREHDHETLVGKLGILALYECFYAVPYRSMGGSGNIDTYQKGNIWVHLDLYGQTVGL